VAAEDEDEDYDGDGDEGDEDGGVDFEQSQIGGTSLE